MSAAVSPSPRLLITEPNLLILDEPTTHLDIPSREALESLLGNYGGTMLFVSHDRRLISLLATQLWIVEDGGANLFRGSFEEWMRLQRNTAQIQTAVHRQCTRSQDRVAGNPTGSAAHQPRRSARSRQSSGTTRIR